MDTPFVLRKRQLVFARVAALVLVAVSVAAASFVPVPAKVPAVALKSEWVFRGIVFVACPVGIGVVWSIVASVLDGRPLQKLGFGPFSLEREAQVAKEVLLDGKQALEVARDADPASGAYEDAMARFRQSIEALDEMVDGRS